VKPCAFEYLAPETSEEAMAALAEYGDEASVLAGGQSLIPMMNLRIGHPAIRNRGTVCGSVAHADPAAEVPAVLLALDGEAVPRSARGRRPDPLGRLSRLYVDAVTTTSASAFGAVAEFFAADRIVFGSDYPYVPIEATAGGLRSLAIDDDTLEAIGRANALGLLDRVGHERLHRG
jgi:hypothetical protein